MYITCTSSGQSGLIHVAAFGCNRWLKSQPEVQLMRESAKLAASAIKRLCMAFGDARLVAHQLHCMHTQRILAQPHPRCRRCMRLTRTAKSEQFLAATFGELLLFTPRSTQGSEITSTCCSWVVDRSRMACRVRVQARRSTETCLPSCGGRGRRCLHHPLHPQRQGDHQHHSTVCSPVTYLLTRNLLIARADA